MKIIRVTMITSLQTLKVSLPLTESFKKKARQRCLNNSHHNNKKHLLKAPSCQEVSMLQTLIKLKILSSSRNLCKKRLEELQRKMILNH
jgi:hypothetical protein